MARFATVKTNSTALKAAITVAVGSPLAELALQPSRDDAGDQVERCHRDAVVQGARQVEGRGDQVVDDAQAAAANAQNAMSVRHFCAAERKAPSVGGLIRKTA